MPSTSPLAPGFAWDERIGKYRSVVSGRFVSFSAVRDACASTARASGANIARLADDLRGGRLSLAEWQSGMMREIKILHTAEAAAARGGWAQMSQSDWGYVGSLVKKQYAYLDRFAAQIESGEQALNGRFNVRAGMYGKAGNGTYEEMRRRWQRMDNAMTEERRVKTASESCPGCIEQAAVGWAMIGTLDPIGAEECRTNCQCYFEYRRMGADGEYITSD